ncbi:hypothetical protein NC651_027130 [Populus alba x Populus x berolinensis]|nr:hypothetical protein NC651_027130 [Populus alba x Populus x berolinensis]
MSERWKHQVFVLTDAVHALITIFFVARLMTAVLGDIYPSIMQPLFLLDKSAVTYTTSSFVLFLVLIRRKMWSVVCCNPFLGPHIKNNKIQRNSKKYIIKK